MSETLRVVLSVVAIGTWAFIVTTRLRKIIEKTVEKTMSNFFHDHKI